MKASAWAASRRRERGPPAHVVETAAQARRPAGPRLALVREPQAPRPASTAATARKETASASRAASIPAPATTSAGDRRTAGGADGEGDVEQRVSLAQLARGRERRGRRGPGQRARGRGERAVDVASASTATSTKSSTSSARTANADRLGRVEQRQRDSHGQRLQQRDERRAEQGGGEVHPAEQRRGRHRAAGLVEDEHRERDLAEPVAELVDEVGEAQVGKARQAKGAQRGGHQRPNLLQRLPASLQDPVSSSACKFVQVFVECRVLCNFRGHETAESTAKEGAVGYRKG